MANDVKFLERFIGQEARKRNIDPDSAVQYARSPNNIREGIISTAKALGMSPQNLATIISYETGGTFNPTQRGPRTQWGQHRGLIQFGEPQAKQYRVDWNNPVSSQLGPNGAVANYFRGHGWKPGMGMLDAYSIVNAGGPGRYDAMDSGSSVRNKVETQMGGHMAKANSLLGGTIDPTTTGSIDGEGEDSTPPDELGNLLGDELKGDEKDQSLGGLLAEMGKPQKMLPIPSVLPQPGGGGSNVQSLPEYIQQFIALRMRKPPDSGFGGGGFGGMGGQGLG